MASSRGAAGCSTQIHGKSTHYHGKDHLETRDPLESRLKLDTKEHRRNTIQNLRKPLNGRISTQEAGQNVTKTLLLLYTPGNCQGGEGGAGD